MSNDTHPFLNGHKACELRYETVFFTELNNERL